MRLPVPLIMAFVAATVLILHVNWNVEYPYFSSYTGTRTLASGVNFVYYSSAQNATVVVESGDVLYINSYTYAYLRRGEMTKAYPCVSNYVYLFKYDMGDVSNVGYIEYKIFSDYITIVPLYVIIDTQVTPIRTAFNSHVVKVYGDVYMYVPKFTEAATFRSAVTRVCVQNHFGQVYLFDRFIYDWPNYKVYVRLLNPATNAYETYELYTVDYGNLVTGDKVSRQSVYKPYMDNTGTVVTQQQLNIFFLRTQASSTIIFLSN